MSKEKLLDMALNNKRHADAGTMELVENIVKIPASNYFDQERWNKAVSYTHLTLPTIYSV